MYWTLWIQLYWWPVYDVSLVYAYWILCAILLNINQPLSTYMPLWSDHLEYAFMSCVILLHHHKVMANFNVVSILRIENVLVLVFVSVKLHTKLLSLTLKLPWITIQLAGNALHEVGHTNSIKVHKFINWWISCLEEI